MSEAGPEASQRGMQQKRSKGTRAKLIEAAINLIREQGAANFTTAKVAEAAGLTRGAIQYHFSSPKDLLREVVVEIVHFLSDQLDEVNLSALNKEDRLERVVDLYWEGYRSDNYVVFIELTLQGRLDPEFRETIQEAISVLERERDDQWLGLFTDYDLSDTEILSWRSTLLIILRGLALKQMFTDAESEVQEIFQNAKESYIRDIQYREAQGYK